MVEKGNQGNNKPRVVKDDRKKQYGAIFGIVVVVIILLFLLAMKPASVWEENYPCFKCHSEYDKMGSLPYVHTAFASEGCLSCHTKHGEEKVTTTFAMYTNALMNAVFGRKEKRRTTISSAKNGRPEKISKVIKPQEVLCNDCHGSDQYKAWKKAEYSHPPYKDNKCTSCHDPHASKYVGVTREEPKELCPSCHNLYVGDGIRSGWFKKKVIHPPVKLKNCADCHDPHASDVKFHLRMEQKKLCTICHQKIALLFNKKHKMAPFEKGECTKCHNPHASDYRKLWKAGPSLEDMCFSCHDGTNGVSDIKKLASKKYKMKPFEQGKCLDCHFHHASDDPKLLKGKGNDFCYKCHGKYKKNYLPISHNTKAGINKDSPNSPLHGKGSCLNCHVPHGSDHFGLVYKEIIQLCTTCHNKDVFRGYKRDVPKPHIAHPVGLNIDDPWRGNYMRCSSCHNPMGSGISKLKRKEYDNLCLQCHNQDDPTWIKGRKKKKRGK